MRDEAGPHAAGRLLAGAESGTGRFQRRHLNSGVWIIRGEVRVTDQCCTKVLPPESLLSSASHPISLGEALGAQSHLPDRRG